MRYRISIELQRVFCATCNRNGRYFAHWHRGHRIGARR